MLRRGALALLMLAGGSASVEPPAENEIALISTDDPAAPFAFEPAELTVETGTMVRWRNTTGDVFHTVTFTDSPRQRRDNGVFNESLFAGGDVVEYTFDEPGTYAYFCHRHSEFMAGTVVVVVASQERSTTWRWWAAGVTGSLALAGLVVITSRRSRRTVTDR